MDETAREVRAARNQALFRTVNENLERLQTATSVELCEWVCECADTRCLARLELSIEEYEQVRSSPTRFFVCPGHVYPDVERTVDSNDRYVVVEKCAAGGVEAANLDHRAHGRPDPVGRAA